MISERLSLALKSAFKAGDGIMKIYLSDDFEVVKKQDDSPLTKADKLAHSIIIKGLTNSEFPVISEEGEEICYTERKNWDTFWMIDPIDGTKEFIKRNGEFTVNIALIELGQPVLGVVYAPVLNTIYFAEKDFGAFKITDIKSFSELNSKEIIDLKKVKYPEFYTLVVSKSHMNKETQNFVDRKKQEYGKINTKSFGSSLKICKVAEGSANCYPRFGPTMEWDTAAAHAIAKFSECTVLQSKSLKELTYNKETLLNPFFIVENV
jgi:3'(2'), 5'-bisphosphate nucleotidase